MRIEKSLRLRLRDVLILTLSNVTPDEEDALNQLAVNLSNTCNIPIIVLRDGMAIDSISEADMLRAGWMRTERRSNGGNGYREQPEPAVADGY